MNTIVIPMAGLSSRFKNDGYTLPKYMLYVKDRSLFNLAISSFKEYFASWNFVFVARDVFDTGLFIQEECRLLGIKHFKVIILDRQTRGQAETVYLGIKKAKLPKESSLLIFNIDTFRPGFKFPTAYEQWDGFLECFIGEGKNWSYAKTMDGSPSSRVIETAEKKEISRYCSTGIYYFKYAEYFIQAFADEESKPQIDTKELYVAPLYNHLIHNGKNIRLSVIERSEVIFCGLPQEYLHYLNTIVLSK